MECGYKLVQSRGKCFRKGIRRIRQEIWNCRGVHGHCIQVRYLLNIEFEYFFNTCRLWNGSWADDSVRWDEVNRVAYEPSRIKIEHKGKDSWTRHSKPHKILGKCTFRYSLQIICPPSTPSFSSKNPRSLPSWNIQIRHGICSQTRRSNLHWWNDTITSNCSNKR